MTSETAAVKACEAVGELMQGIGRAARGAAQVLALTPTEQKNRALRAAAAALRTQRPEILATNASDMHEAVARGLSGALLDRLRLDDKRVEAMAQGLDDIERLPDQQGMRGVVTRMRARMEEKMPPGLRARLAQKAQTKEEGA